MPRNRRCRATCPDLVAAHTHDQASLDAAFQTLTTGKRKSLCEALRRCEPETVAPAKVADMLEKSVNGKDGLEFGLNS